MMKPGLPQGTRDFSPLVVKKRHYIFSVIRNEMEHFGFQPLETPAMENLDTLIGKYGEEGDKLMFKILNNGLERPEKHEQARADFNDILQGKSKKSLTERALKYDLTIPFARYVAMNHGQLTFPFKRYQIQPVWRADRPQRGRYREFYQCDADIVGSQSPFNEIELIELYTRVFEKLEIPVKICINNRKILSGLAERCGGQNQMNAITVAIDKLDKIGAEKVHAELETKGLAPFAIETVMQYLRFAQAEQTNLELLQTLRTFFEHSTIGTEGVNELAYLIEACPHIALDVTLARGLDYYTGTILEVKPLNIAMGSIGGGGRYDDLTGLFGVPNIPGVGISFGVDRIYDVMEEKNLFPEAVQTNAVQVMLVNFGETYRNRNREVLNFLRDRNISCELYPDPVKFDKQLKYADKRGVEFVMLIGETELAQNIVALKNFKTGEQSSMPLENVLHVLK